MCSQIHHTNGLWYSAEYSTFSISDEVGKYRLPVAGYSGDAGDPLRVTYSSWFKANGQMFSTPDSDNDRCPCSCAGQRSNGWWYNYCSTSFLNNMGTAIWKTDYPAISNVQVSHMLVKF